jgi:hypothetical protein
VGKILILIKSNRLKKFGTKLILILFLSTFSFSANAKVSILTWQEQTNLTTIGKNSEVIIKGRISELPQNEYLSSFGIVFDARRTIKITKALCDGRPANYSFTDNVLKFKFDQNKGNNAIVSINFAYEENYIKINKFLREEPIDIPYFAEGADAKVTISFPGYLESATLNPNLTKIGNSFIYSRIVPKNGVQEIIKLTPSQSVWNVLVRVKVNANQALDKIMINLPIYFKNGGQRITDSSTKSSVTPENQEKQEDSILLKYNTTEKEIIIEDAAKIYTGINNRSAFNRNPNDYLKFSPDEWSLLSQKLEEIKHDPKYQGLPLYAKIGKFVHEYIKYDISYSGKLPEIKEIIKTPIGVCTEYARLFDAFARVAGIPSLMLDGAACGEYGKCDGHSWNLIYYNNNWIEVDPTWDLMSGIVSSSHIYFNDTNKGRIKIQYLEGKSGIRSDMDFEMKNVF